MTALPITRIVLYKHGIGYFERQAIVENDATLNLTFKQTEVSDVLKSLTVLDLDGGHVASVSYDSTKPLEQLLAEVALSIPDENSVVGLLPQIKGARLAVQSSGSESERTEGVLLGVDRGEKRTAEGIVKIVLVSLLTDRGEIRSFDLHALTRLEVLDPALRRDLEYYLRTVLSSKKKEVRTFTFFARGQGRRTIRLSYTLEAPVWKATYRIILEKNNLPPTIQGWAVVDNTQDEDWENVRLSLVSGLPVSFVHDLYTPRYIRRPVVEVKETTGVLPPEVEVGMAPEEFFIGGARASDAVEAIPAAGGGSRRVAKSLARMRASTVSSTPAQVRERKLGDLFEYEIEHPVTIRRNQSALVPIVLRAFEGRSVLLYNKATRPDNPMRCVEFKNTTGLTLEGGPVTVLEGGNYVGEAMLDTMKPDEERLMPYAVELGVFVLSNLDSHQEKVHRVVIRDRRLTTYRLEVRQTSYSFHNKSDTARIVYLDHLRDSPEWQLFDTPSPREITENHWRFRFDLPAKTTMAFVVRQRLTTQHAESFSDLSANHLGYWLEQKYVDAATEQVLRQLMDLQHKAAERDKQIENLREESARLHAEQGRIRENLQALGDRASEKELRERFVRTLHDQEDRLELISRTIEEYSGERDHCREQINDVLANLEYEAAIG